MAIDRDLERPRRHEDEYAQDSPRKEEEQSLRASEGEREDGARFAAISGAMKEALAHGKIDEDRLSPFTSEEQAALEALAVARSGSDKSHSRRDYNYVSAPERKRLLNAALAELQPLLASAQCSTTELLHAELLELRELIGETRHDIAQRALVESGAARKKRADEELDEEDDGDEDDGDEDDESSSQNEGKNKPSGFLSLLKGARRRRQSGANDKNEKSSKGGGGDGDSTL